MPIPIFHVDAFAEHPFEGNPAAVCLLDAAMTDSWRQSFAAEMNLSETAFIELPNPESNGEFQLRWFTPLAEVDLCGHATLASAHVLWETETVSAGADISFQSRSGRLTARQVGSQVELDFPASSLEPTEVPKELIQAMGLTDDQVVGGCRTAFDLLIEVADASIVSSAEPDFVAIGKLDVRGVILTSAGGTGPFSQFDFVSRFFAPTVGVNEDPVTGSAHCSLGPYWKSKLGKDKLLAKQISKRGGIVEVEIVDDRVLLRGSAVTVFSGTLRQPT